MTKNSKWIYSNESTIFRHIELKDLAKEIENGHLGSGNKSEWGTV